MSPVRKITRARLATPIALAIIAFSVFAQGSAPRRIETLPVGLTDVSVKAGVGQPPGMYFSGGNLFVPGAQPVRLAATPSSPLTGWLSPAIVPAPDRRTVLYATWRQLRADDPAQSWSKQGIELGDPLGIPEIRRVDLVTGSDTLYVSGATSPMISSSGAVAYVRGTSSAYTAGDSYQGTIVVRASFDAPPVTWTATPQKYAIAAWADTHLLAYEIGEGESLSLVVLDGPDRIRALAPGTLVALSGDAGSAFIEQSGRVPVQVAVVNIEDGLVAETLPIDQGAAATYGIDVLSYAGAWTGNFIVARTGTGLVIFEETVDGLIINDALSFDPGPFPSGVIQLRFSQADGSEITAWGDQTDPTGVVRTVELVCQRVTRTCTSFPMVDQLAQPGFNPSAPFNG